MAWDTVIFVFVVDEIPMLLHTLADFSRKNFQFPYVLIVESLLNNMAIFKAASMCVIRCFILPFYPWMTFTDK